MKWRSIKFTLIELLVVVAIIGILASILLPALKKAKDQAKKIACTNNMKQCGVHTHMYFQDYNNYLVSVDAQNGWGTWGTTLYKGGYITTGEQVVRCTEALEEKPSSPTDEDPIKYYIYSANFSGLFKGDEGVGRVAWGSHAENRAFFMTRITQPSEYVLMLDGKRNGTRQNAAKFWKGPVPGNWSARPWTIHQKNVAVNTLFADGHASMTDMTVLKQLINNDLYSIYHPEMSW